MTREHYNGQAPDWSRKAHTFRHLDGSDADWRSAAAVKHRPGNRRRVRDPDDRVAAIFTLGMGWGVLCSILAVQAARAMGWL